MSAPTQCLSCRSRRLLNLLSTIRLCRMVLSIRTIPFPCWVQLRDSCSFEVLQKALTMRMLIVTHWRSRLMKSPRSVARWRSSIANMHSPTFACASAIRTIDESTLSRGKFASCHVYMEKCLLVLFGIGLIRSCEVVAKLNYAV
jgi:hypothetical protein